MDNSHIKDFTKGNISKQMIVFTLPLFLSNLLQIVYNMVDMMVVGNALGSVGISAVSVGGDISHLLTFIAMGISSAGQVIIARYIGGEQREKISRFIGTMFGFLIASALALSVLGIVFRHTLIELMNTPQEAYQGAYEYSIISMIGLVFIYGYNAVSAILRGMGDSKHPFIFISIAAILNLVLDLFFVMFLDMGAGGAALATVISQGISFISCFIFLLVKADEFQLEFNFKDYYMWDKEMLSSLLRLGVPMAIKTASIMVSKLFVNSYINSYGIAVSAFSGIANKLASVANLISTALNTAGSTMVGQNIAAAEFKRVKKILINIAAISFGVAIFLSMAIVLFPEKIFGIFTDDNDTQILAIAQKFIPIAILLFFGASCRAIMNALINGSGNYKINFATAVLDGIVFRIGLALLFGLTFGLKHYGFWLGDALAGFTPFFIGIVFYFSGQWKKGSIKNK